MDDEYWATFPVALTTADVARILRISERTAVRRLREGRLPGYRLTTSWIVFRDELRALLDAASNRSTAPAAAVDALAGYPEELGYRDLMDLLGKTKPTIYAWLDAGTLPAYRVEGRWTVYRHELRQALDDVRNTPRLDV
jgi:excisionase family DNA binding protein